eukprot:scaffold286520_cov19-Tisochrysis_lutea.AAC.1
MPLMPKRRANANAWPRMQREQQNTAAPLMDYVLGVASKDYRQVGVQIVVHNNVHNNKCIPSLGSSLTMRTAHDNLGRASLPVRIPQLKCVKAVLKQNGKVKLISMLLFITGVGIEGRSRPSLGLIGPARVEIVQGEAYTRCSLSQLKTGNLCDRLSRQDLSVLEEDINVPLILHKHLFVLGSFGLISV